MGNAQKRNHFLCYNFKIWRTVWKILGLFQHKALPSRNKNVILSMLLSMYVQGETKGCVCMFAYLTAIHITGQPFIKINKLRNENLIHPCCNISTLK